MRQTLLMRAFIAGGLLVAAAGRLQPVAAAPAAISFPVASTLDVVDDAPGDGQCHTLVSSPAGGLCTLRAAVMEADATSGAGAAIIVPAGIYSLTISASGSDGPEKGDLNLTAPSDGDPLITITGAGAGRTIIDANQLDRVLRVALGRTAAISGLTLRNGYLVADYGAGIYNLGHATLDHVAISGSLVVISSGYQAGGMQNSGMLTITDSTIGPNNTAYFCGGLCNDGTLLIERSTITGNRAGDGGGAGIYNDPGYSMVLLDSTISTNTTTNTGGGIYNGGTANVYNLTIAFNTADSANAAGNYGGGVDSGSGGTSAMRNTLLAGNNRGNGTPDDCNGTVQTYGNNLLSTLDRCTLSPQDVGTTGALNDILLIGPLANNGGPTLTHALLPGSNAIDGGDASFGCTNEFGDLIATDQRGALRTLGAACDVGALEALPPAAFLPLLRR